MNLLIDASHSISAIVLNVILIPPDGEGLEPRFCRRWLHVAERICKRIYSVFYLMKDAFSTVPISVAGYLKSEPESFQRGFERVRSIDEERRLLDLLFLAEFAQERCGALRILV